MPKKKNNAKEFSDLVLNIADTTLSVSAPDRPGQSVPPGLGQATHLALLDLFGNIQNIDLKNERYVKKAHKF